MVHGRAAIALALTALLPSVASAAEADGTSCQPGAPYVGAPLRAALDPALLPPSRPLSSDPMPEELSRRLDATFAQLLARTDATAASVALWKPGVGAWTRTSGVADGGPTAFWWASTGKLATATVIEQLIAEGKLDRTAPVGAYFPRFEAAGTATIADLLRHTSGIFSFNADLRLRERTGFKAPDELIDVARGHPLDFCPGTNWNYSNTGYVMLGRIAEMVEGEPLGAIVQRRIAAPLGLSSFRVLRADDVDGAMVALVVTSPDRVAEVASVHGAGAVVASAPDMLAFLHGYLEGRLASPDTRRRATTDLHPMFGTTMTYGEGIMVTDVPDAAQPTVWMGHSGGSPDAKGLVLYDTRRDTYLAIALNNQAPAEAIANALLKLLD